jgi:hypothetical protein
LHCLRKLSKTQKQEQRPFDLFIELIRPIYRANT